MRNRRSFTLIELLVVVAIIAVLVAVLLPALSEAREQSRKVTCLANTRQVSIIMRYYVDDHNGYMPPGDPDYAGPDHWFFRLIPYVFVEWTWTVHGEAIHQETGAICSNPRSIGFHYYDCPNVSAAEHAVSPWPDCKMNAYMWVPVTPAPWVPYPLDKLGDPTNTVLLAERDGGNWHVTPASFWFPDVQLPAKRHNGKCNVMWCDLHASDYDAVKLAYTDYLWDRE